MSNASFHTGRHFLQIPGPTNVPDRVLRAMDMLGNLEAAFPDALPGGDAFAAPGRLRQRASGSRKRSAG